MDARQWSSIDFRPSITLLLLLDVARIKVEITQHVASFDQLTLVNSVIFTVFMKYSFDIVGF